MNSKLTFSNFGTKFSESMVRIPKFSLFDESIKATNDKVSVLNSSFSSEISEIWYSMLKNSNFCTKKIRK